MGTIDTSQARSFGVHLFGGADRLQKGAELRCGEAHLLALPLADSATAEADDAPDVLQREAGALSQSPQKGSQHGGHSCSLTGTALLRSRTGNKGKIVDAGYDSEMNPIQTLLRQRRKNLGLSTRQLADRLGVAHTAVQKWETGTNDVPLSRIEPWTSALGLRLHIVVTPEGDSAPPPTDTMTDAQRGLVRAVLDLVPEMTDAEAEILRGQMEYLAARRRRA